MAPLVSILVPAFNAAPWLAETLESALSQTWTQLEVIVVDDGSTDATPEIARRYQSGRLKVVTQKNSGVCAARNAALSLAQGDYVQWLDSDDCLAPRKVEHQMAAAGDVPAEALLTAPFGRFYYRPRKARFEPSALWRTLPPLEWVRVKFNEAAWMNPASWLLGRALVDRTGPWDTRIARSGDDDGEYICRAALLSSAVVFVPEAACYYRVGRPTSLSARRSEQAHRELVLSTELSIRHLLAHSDSEEDRRACVRLLEQRMWHFFPDRPELMQAIQGLATELGARELRLIETPRYNMAATFIGHNGAKYLRRLTSSVLVGGMARRWDGCMRELERLLPQHRDPAMPPRR